MSEPEFDVVQLREAARAYLEWEAELTGCGLAPHEPSARAAVASARPPASEPTAVLLSPTVVGSGIAPAAVERPAPALRLDATTSFDEPRAAIAASAPALTTPAPSAADRRARLSLIDHQVQSCSRCELAKGRTHTVFARGNPDSPVVFVGEGPGQEEDRVGAPFVGPAGQLLDKMVAAMGFARDDVYICNVVKCRPPGNRTPLPAEAGACAPFLIGQLEAIRPQVIVALGRCAAENMGLVQGGGWRGRWGIFQGVDVMPTYHPAFLLRSPEYKRPVWEDLQKVMSKLKPPV